MDYGIFKFYGVEAPGYKMRTSLEQDSEDWMDYGIFKFYGVEAPGYKMHTSLRLLVLAE